MIKALFFDFDGVILDSMPVRTMGFSILFQDHPDHLVERLLDFHRLNGGLSRFVKIRHFYEDILGKPIAASEVEAHAKRFSEVMREHMLDPGLRIQETISFIEDASTRVPLHVVSGSEQEELRWLCRRHGLDRHFVSIHGSPTAKKDLVKQLVAGHGYAPEKAALIGDSINDLEAARASGVAFWGYNEPQLRGPADKYIHSFSEQRDELLELLG